MTTRGAATGNRERRRYPTRDDVARMAGTSTAVVSYVVNGGPRRVSPATRERVEKAIAELDYRPNALARSLRARRTLAIGLIVPDMANPFFGELARSVEDHGFEAGNALLVGNSMGSEERERLYVELFLEYRIGGLILVPVGDGRSSADRLRRSAVPVVALDRYVHGLAAPTIVPDNVEGAAAATAHLLEHGHGVVACMAGPVGLTSAEERVEGWARALDRAAVPVPRRTVVRTAFDRAAGYHAAIDLLGGRDRPSALFVASDEQAFGVLRAAAHLGVRVPDDLAVVGFDGLEQGAFTVPGLTTMRQDMTAAGELAVRTLAGGAHKQPGGTVRLPVRLCRRGSCGCQDQLDEGGVW